MKELFYLEIYNYANIMKNKAVGLDTNIALSLALRLVYSILCIALLTNMSRQACW